ncbi:MAG: helix-turn-helix transcriptional regulator [Clostridia bacterium]|nr:helix-turn-helix transcriptional regulator [Clostridia bacterium]
MIYQNQHFGVSEYFCKETGENFSFPAHIHHSFELITMLDGKMTVHVGEKSYEIGRGEGVLVFPEQIHALSGTDCKHLLVIFSPETVSAYYPRHACEIPQNSKIAIPDYLLAQLIELEQTSSTVRTKAVLYAVCATLDENTAYVKRKTVGSGLLQKIFDFVEQNYDKSCTLEDLSRATGYHPSYLSRYFSESTGMSFISMVNRRRIDRACYLLRNTDKPIIECAYDCGYTSLRSFNRNFKLCVGIPPKEYRENA